MLRPKLRLATLLALALCHLGAANAGKERTTQGFLSAPHNKIVNIDQKTSNITWEQQVAIDFNPSLKVINGCDPFPAVNETGIVSEGLKGKGDNSGDCQLSDKTESQVYVRQMYLPAPNKTVLATQYVWFLPKTGTRTIKNKSCNDWVGGCGGDISTGERYGFQDAVLLHNTTADHTARELLAVSVSWNGPNYKQFRADTIRNKERNGTHVRLKLSAHKQQRLFHLDMTHHEGDLYPIVFWDDLQQRAKEVLGRFSFGNFVFPGADGVFESAVARATEPQDHR